MAARGWGREGVHFVLVSEYVEWRSRATELPCLYYHYKHIMPWFRWTQVKIGKQIETNSNDFVLSHFVTNLRVVCVNALYNKCLSKLTSFLFEELSTPRTIYFNGISSCAGVKFLNYELFSMMQYLFSFLAKSIMEIYNYLKCCSLFHNQFNALPFGIWVIATFIKLKYRN